MATYRLTGPDGATYTVTAPEQASEEQVLAYAQQQWGTPAAAQAPAPYTPTPPPTAPARTPTAEQRAEQQRRAAMTPQQRAVELEREHANFQTAQQRINEGDWGALKNYADALQHRTLDVVGGIAQLGGHGVQALTDYLPEDNALRQRVAADNAQLDEHLAQRETDYQQRTTCSVAADVGGALGSVLPYLIPGKALQGAGTKLASAVLPRAAATGAGRAMVSGATQGALSSAVAPVTQAGDYAQHKWQQLGAGTVLGALAPAAARLTAPVLGKVLNTARGVIDPTVRQLQALGERYNIPLTYGDLTQKALPRKIETALEAVPVLGTGGLRAQQQEQARKAAEGLSAQLRTQLQRTPFTDLAQVEAAAAQGHKIAQALQQEISSAGDDWHRILQASGNLRAFAVKQKVDALYNEVERLAAGSGSIALPRTLQAVNRGVEEATAAKLPDPSTLRVLQQIRTALTPADGAPRTDNTYSAMRQLRSDLGDVIQDYYRGTNAVTGSKGVGALQAVRNAVETDMNAFASRSGNPALTRAWKTADAFYRDQVVPFKDRQLASALKDAHADEVYAKFIQAGKGERAAHFYRALDAKGQAAVRYGMVTHALDTALDDTRQVFSPAKFAQSLERVKEAQDAIFRGSSQREIEGLTQLMRHIERAGQYAENPPTGQRVIPWLLGGTAALNAPLAIKAAAATAATRALLTTAPGKRFLLAASKLDDASPAMAKLLRRMEATMPKVAGAMPTDAPGLDIDITGGTPGPVISEEELEALRTRSH